MSNYNQAEPQKSIGALWVKTSKKGVQYMSGVVEINGEKHSIACFTNKKTKPNQPDYRILLSDPNWKTKQGGANGTSSEPVGEVNVEDVPF